MTEVIPNTSRLNPEARRRQRLAFFKTQFKQTSEQISLLLGVESPVRPRYEENDQPSDSDDYYIKGLLEIPNVLMHYYLVWLPNAGILKRFNIMLEESHTNDYSRKHYGTQINQLTEQLARNLGAEKFVIENITNTRWQSHLLRNGFTAYSEFAVVKNIGIGNLEIR